MTRVTEAGGKVTGEGGVDWLTVLCDKAAGGEVVDLCLGRLLVGGGRRRVEVGVLGSGVELGHGGM